MKVETNELSNNQKIVLANRFKYHRIFLSRIDRIQLDIHQHYEIVYIISGKIQVETDVETRVLVEGQAYVLNPNIVHRVEALTEDNIVLCFEGYKIENYSQFKLAKDQVISNEFGDNISEELGSILGNLYLLSLTDRQEYQNVEEEEYELLKKIAKIFIGLDKIHEKSCDKSNVQCLVLEIVRDIPKMIKNNQDLSLEKLAENNNISYSYLSRIFKEVVGMTYTEYLLNVRLNRAIELILNTDKKILDVAITSGFYSIKTFNNTFKRIFNISPTQFRSKYKDLGPVIRESSLYLDRKTQDYLEKIKGENSSNIDKTKYIIDTKAKPVAIKQAWGNIVELDYFLGNNPKFSELEEVFKKIELEYLIIDLSFERGKLYLVRGNGRKIEKDNDFCLKFIKFLERHNINPVIRLAIEDIEGDKAEDFFTSFQEKLKTISLKIGLEKIRKYRFELYIRQIEGYYLIEKRQQELVDFIYRFKAILKKVFKREEIFWGIYLGGVDFPYLKGLDNLFTRIGLPEFINLDLKLNRVDKKTVLNIVKLLDSLDDYFLLKFHKKVRILVNISYSLEEPRLEVDKEFYYNDLFLLSLLIKLEWKNYTLLGCDIIHREKLYKSYFHNEIGIELTSYYVFMLIKDLEEKVLYLKPGIVVTSGQDNISIFLYEYYVDFLKNTQDIGLDEYKNIEKTINLSLLGLEGTYKVTQYVLRNTANIIEENFNKEMLEKITEEEKKFLSKQYMPEVNLDFKAAKDLENLKIKKKALDGLLIKISKI